MRVASRLTDGQTAPLAGRQERRQADRQTDRQTDRPVGRQTDRQTDRQAGRQASNHWQADELIGRLKPVQGARTDSHIHTYSYTHTHRQTHASVCAMLTLTLLFHSLSLSLLHIPSVVHPQLVFMLYCSYLCLCFCAHAVLVQTSRHVVGRVVSPFACDLYVCFVFTCSVLVLLLFWLLACSHSRSC